jgi:hypothetical protein
MKCVPKFLQGIALSALTSVLLCGSALAVPAPTYPRFDPGADPSLTTVSSATQAPGARTLFRTSDPLLAQATFGGGGAEGATTVGPMETSRSKSRYVMPAMILAALTPLALHHFGEPGDKSVAVQTRTPASSSSSLTDLGNALLGGGGHGRGRNGNNGNGEGNGDGDDGGGQVCDGGGSGGDSGGDCDDDGDDDGNGAPGGGGGDDGGGGGANLPEPGTVPLLGAGLMMALAFRWRRND